MRPDILIAEDDATLAEELAALLSAHGFSVCVACSTEEIRQKIGGSFLAIILDLSMPIDGFALLEMIGRGKRTVTPELIIASGQNPRIVRAAERMAQAMGLSVAATLQKPYAPQKLLDILSALKESKASPAPCASLCPMEAWAMNESDFHVVFQGKYALDGSRSAPLSYEALLRRNTGRSIEPMFAAHVPLPIQMQATRFVFAQVEHLWAARPEIRGKYPIAVNISPDLICSHEFQDFAAALQRRDASYVDAVQFELTEQMTDHDFTLIAAAASRLAMRGFDIAIDDFGCGSTSFERVIDLPVSEVKIAKEIFWSAAAGKIPAGMLRETISYCRDQDIAVTVEGIETQEEQSFALGLGANIGQGFLWGLPETVGVAKVAHITQRRGYRAPVSERAVAASGV